MLLVVSVCPIDVMHPANARRTAKRRAATASGAVQPFGNAAPNAISTLARTRLRMELSVLDGGLAREKGHIGRCRALPDAACAVSDCELPGPRPQGVNWLFRVLDGETKRFLDRLD